MNVFSVPLKPHGVLQVVVNKRRTVKHQTVSCRSHAHIYGLHLWVSPLIGSTVYTIGPKTWKIITCAQKHQFTYKKTERKTSAHEKSKEQSNNRRRCG